jgi:hypothetical protein
MQRDPMQRETPPDGRRRGDLIFGGMSGGADEMAVAFRTLKSSSVRAARPPRVRAVNRAERRHAAARGDRQFRRFVEGLVRCGGADCCHGCGRALRSGQATLTGLDARGRGLTAAQCCQDRVVVGLALGLYLSARDAPAEWLAGVRPRGSA